ncbi:alpha-L-arabinofuranosidase [Flaviramulus sp. BrNp1-15]|uniref:alpha-L-arabinofuranosidase C-terminal domain-containing protein n=1 Tax=Flaviramulus sp. BrNp1-15 TaxID=2916754 RepID=UPI001EE7FC29|nr:alpha-L-arabinofuranosidase C-terminal domain-containing protein [Flaviramulus sp. BrNp1-15]ULC58027.1 alpha-L-arabinofuranosidase [Flaviramulus sp. BrNp1-15]
MKQSFLKHTFFIGLIVSGFVSCKDKVDEENVSETTSTSNKTVNLVVDLKDTGIKIQPTMYGIFFEDINFSADGGLYAELIKNRSFEFPDAKMGWKQPNSARPSLNGNSGFAKITNYVTPKGGNKKYSHTVVHNDDNYELINEGFRGIGLKQGKRYDLSVMMAHNEGIEKINFSLVDSTGIILASTDFKPKNDDWKTYEAVLMPNKTEAKAMLKITFEGTGSVDLDMISLFPQDTWKGRKKGLRKDLVELLDDLNPGFLRFPGGCIVEGRSLAQRYQWQKTVGPVLERELLINRWNNLFDHRPAHDYFQSFGLGFFEYFQLSEDLGAEPIPILGCGMACQFNTGELVPLENLDPYVQEALNLVEFANGDIETPWGKLRSEMGHPEPFNMKYLGIGNEQWGPEYFERYEVFVKAISEKYPDIIIVSTPGPFPDGDMFDYGWEQLKRLNAALADEHYYRPPEWFRANADRYDSYDRDGVKVFAGEYAAHPKGVDNGPKENNWDAALSEAAFMTGLERNADVVHLTAYAPLMAHEKGWQWAPDLIWFNNLESYGTPNYYVQKLFSNNPGTDLLKITQNGKPLIGQNELFASAVKDVKTNNLIIKAVNTSKENQTIVISTSGTLLKGKGTITILRSDDLLALNSFEKPNNITLLSEEFEIIDEKIVIQLKSQSMNVIKIKI